MKQVQVPEFDFEFDESWHLYGDVVFHHEMRELLRGEVSYDEGDNKEKARRVLEYGSQQILNDETSSPFMRYVAICFKRHLEGKKGKTVSLDVAFSIERGRGKPKDDPAKFDHVVAAYYTAAADVTLRTPDERQARGFDAAFRAHHGRTEEEFKRSGKTGIDPKSIDNMKVATRNLLQDRGLYQKRRKAQT